MKTQIEESMNVDLTDEEKKVFKIVNNWSNERKGGWDGYWYGYFSLSDETQLSEYKLKKIMKSLKEKGLVELKPTYNSDGILSGKGWFTSEKVKVHNLLKECENAN